ncbi:RNA polymerase sigma factor [Spirosoma areae]
MSPYTPTRYDSELLSGLKADNHVAFAALYDQYAAVLLGYITKIVSDKTQAVVLLETTFRKVRSQIDQYQPDKQPLFTWLLTIARCIAIDSLEKGGPLSAPVFQFTTTGKVVSSTLQTYRATPPPTTSTDVTDKARLKELLDAVLFNNCTPEEAATSIGLPVETARQQLRTAMQQLRQQAT